MYIKPKSVFNFSEFFRLFIDENTQNLTRKKLLNLLVFGDVDTDNADAFSDAEVSRLIHGKDGFVSRHQAVLRTLTTKDMELRFQLAAPRQLLLANGSGRIRDFIQDMPRYGLDAADAARLRSLAGEPYEFLAAAFFIALKYPNKSANTGAPPLPAKGPDVPAFFRDVLAHLNEIERIDIAMQMGSELEFDLDMDLEGVFESVLCGLHAGGISLQVIVNSPAFLGDMTEREHSVLQSEDLKGAFTPESYKEEIIFAAQCDIDTWQDAPGSPQLHTADIPIYQQMFLVHGKWSAALVTPYTHVYSGRAAARYTDSAPEFDWYVHEFDYLWDHSVPYTET